MSDDNVIPVFHMRAIEDRGASKEQGRPVFREVPFVEIIIPGNTRNKPVHKVREEDKERWPTQWAAFENRREQAIEGTPVEEWPQLGVAQVAMLRALNIRTVEHLAHVSDTAIAKLGPGGRDLVSKAKAFLELASGSAKVDKKVEQLEARIKELEDENRRLREQKPKRGRPPKNREEHAETH